MAVGESERRELQEELVGTIGLDAADTLLGYLPPVGWADVATKSDLDALASRLDGRIDRLAGKIDALGSRLGGKIDALHGRLDGKIDALDGRIGRLDQKVENTAVRLEGQLHRELHKQDLWLITMTITIVLAVFAQHYLG